MNTQTIDIETMLGDTNCNGTIGSFIDLGNGWGVKGFLDEKRIRDESYLLQKQYSNHYLAPPCKEPFEVGDWYCYYTRVAEVISPSDGSGWYDANDEEYELMYQHTLMAKNLRLIVLSDHHGGNYGWYKGKFVLVDFY